MIRKQRATKYFLYARKSSEREERQVLSIDSQVRELREQFRDLRIADVLQESASAFKPYNRPVFAKMMEQIRGGEAQGIVAWSPDRLSRNPVDGGQIIYFLDTNDLLDLKFADYHFDHSPAGKMMLGMAFSQSKFSSDKLSVDVKRGLRAKAEKGWLPGVAPAGYVNNRHRDKGEKDISPDPERFHLLRKAFDLVLSRSYTPAQVLRVLNEDWGFRTIKRRHAGGGPLGKSTWYYVLTNPFYCGEFEFNGSRYKGGHEPMITEEEFWRVQEVLGKKGKPRPQTHHFAFSGMLRCAKCGKLFCFEEKTKYYRETDRTAHYAYAYCTGRKKGLCDQPGVRLKDIEQQIKDELSQVTIAEDVKDWALKHLKEANVGEVEDRAAAYQSLQKAYNESQRRLDRLVDLRISEQINEKEYLSKRKALLEEQSRLKAKLDSTENRAKNWRELTEKTFVFATRAKYWFENGTLQDKKEILSTLGSNFTIREGSSLEIGLREPFAVFKEGLKRFGPLKMGAVTGGKAVSASRSTNWLPGLDSNQ